MLHKQNKKKNIQTIHDQSQKHKKIVALKVFDIPHDPFTQSRYRRRCTKVRSLQELHPWPDVLLSLLNPLLGVGQTTRDVQKANNTTGF